MGEIGAAVLRNLMNHMRIPDMRATIKLIAAVEGSMYVVCVCGGGD